MKRKGKNERNIKKSPQNIDNISTHAIPTCTVSILLNLHGSWTVFSWVSKSLRIGGDVWECFCVITCLCKSSLGHSDAVLLLGPLVISFGASYINIEQYRTFWWTPAQSVSVIVSWHFVTNENGTTVYLRWTMNWPVTKCLKIIVKALRRKNIKFT